MEENILTISENNKGDYFPEYNCLKFAWQIAKVHAVKVNWH